MKETGEEENYMQEAGAIIELNPKEKGLTIEKVKSFNGFEQVSDEEAQHIIDTINQFCNIAYECYLLDKENETTLKQVA